MESDVHIFTADGANTVRAERQSLESLGLTEVAHLERWVVDHPEVLGGDVMVVSTQYDRWSSTSGDRAKERLDILGLDVSGQPVVVELKRGSDSRIHLQAITYASLVAGFSENTSRRRMPTTSTGNQTRTSPSMKLGGGSPRTSKRESAWRTLSESRRSF